MPFSKSVISSFILLLVRYMVGGLVGWCEGSPPSKTGLQFEK